MFVHTFVTELEFYRICLNPDSSNIHILGALLAGMKALNVIENFAVLFLEDENNNKTLY